MKNIKPKSEVKMANEPDESNCRVSQKVEKNEMNEEKIQRAEVTLSDGIRHLKIEDPAELEEHRQDIVEEPQTEDGESEEALAASAPEEFMVI